MRPRRASSKRFAYMALCTLGVICTARLLERNTVGVFAANGSPQEAQFGDPLPDSTPLEVRLFLLGRDDFLEVEKPEDGLGPVFNARSCAECHSVPAVGGSGTILELRAGYRDPRGKYFDVRGGSVFQLFSIAPQSCQKQIPPEANVVSFRKSLPIFGDGLIEAIPDSEILFRASANQGHPDGIGGRANLVVDRATGLTRVGRFGWKAQQATLMSFGAEAYRDEMGVTNDLFPHDPDLGFLNERKERECDPAPDPEDKPDPATGLRNIDNFPNFMRFLAPPPRGLPSGWTAIGERIFEQIGCASCHIPQMTTGPAPQEALNRKPVRLFSDLLLHDIGTGDGLAQGNASGDEFRTPPLWGVRARRPFLHDGRAASLEEAIRFHTRQAARSRERFEGLRGTDQTALLQFLQSL